MRLPSGIKTTNKAGVTFINSEGKFTSRPSTGKVAIFEGMFDFLSWRVMQSSELPTCDVVILNSVNNLQKAGHSDYQAMKPYIEIAEKTKADAMKSFEQNMEK